jgi:hypothetical protein
MYKGEDKEIGYEGVAVKPSLSLFFLSTSNYINTFNYDQSSTKMKNTTSEVEGSRAGKSSHAYGNVLLLIVMARCQLHIKLQTYTQFLSEAGPIKFKGTQMNTHYFWQNNFNIYTCI